MTKIETHQPLGLDDLRRAANLAYAPAQLYLGKLYEDGQAGLAKDMTEARRWTERAAENGDARAMHNLGVYYFNGSGGLKNKTLAAQWFRKAADRGLVDSQYNLASLFESGIGVGQNGAEAYKWYLIAGRSGDGESRAAGERMKKQLSAQEQSAAERAAAAFRSTAPVATAQAAPMGAQAQAAITTAQRALSRLGYYQGPTDGAASPALNYAIAAYQKDQGLPATGAISPDLLQRFQMAAR